MGLVACNELRRRRGRITVRWGHFRCKAFHEGDSIIPYCPFGIRLHVRQLGVTKKRGARTVTGFDFVDER